MIIFTIIIAAVVFLGALTMHVMLMYAELKGYERGLDEAEQIMEEVRNERL